MSIDIAAAGLFLEAVELLPRYTTMAVFKTEDGGWYVSHRDASGEALRAWGSSRRSLDEALAVFVSQLRLTERYS